VLEAIAAAQTRLACSLDRPLGEHGDPPVGELVAPESPGVDLEDRILLPELIAGLPAPERLVVWLYYFEELNQSEVAARMGCSQMQVSRLLRRAVRHLRGQLVA
jgi:RNA polymerase sigma-B factor